MIVRSIVDLHKGKISMNSDGVGHGCSSTLELPIIRSPSSQRNRSEVPIICSSGSERERKENEGARRKKGAVVSYMKRETDNQVVDKREKEKEKEEEEEKEKEKEKEEGEGKEDGNEREDRVSELQSLSSAACHSPRSSLNTVMATKLELEEQLADHTSTDVILPSSRASDDSSNYHLPLATKIKKKLYLLVVDDSALNRRMIIKLLGDHICDQAEDGIDAVAKYVERVNLSKSAQTVSSSDIVHIEESPKGCKLYDAILMDFMMPNMDGPTATEIIRGKGYTGPVIGITGKSYSYDLIIKKNSFLLGIYLLHIMEHQSENDVIFCIYFIYNLHHLL